MYDIADIRAAIVTLLQSVKIGSNTAFAFVYDYPRPDPEGYPCAIMDSSSDDGSYLDNVTNLHEITFKIWFIQEITTQGQDASIASLDAVCQAGIQALELLSNTTLSNTVMWTVPTTGKRQQVQTPNGQVFYKEIILKCKVTYQIA